MKFVTRLAELVAGTRTPWEFLVAAVQDLYRRAPRLTALVGLIAVLGAGTFMYRAWQERAARRALLATPPLARFESQVKRLDSVRTWVEDLLVFIQDEQIHIQDVQLELLELTRHQHRLQLIADTDSQAVNAIIGFQLDQASKDGARNLWLGALLGVFGSILAQFLFERLRRFVEPKVGSTPVDANSAAAPVAARMSHSPTEE